MSRKKGQTFSTAFKAKIVLELIKEDSTLNELAIKCKVTSKTILNWKVQFLDNANLAFENDKTSGKIKKDFKDLQSENDELAKALGKTTIQRDWALKKLESLDLLNKKSLVSSKLSKISITSQCKLLNISRTAHYYKQKPISQQQIKIMNRIDEISVFNSEYGYRFIHQHLLEDGFTIGKDRVLKYMQTMGIQAIYPTKKRVLTFKNQQHKIYDYLLKPYWTQKGKHKTIHVNKPNEVWSADITYIRVNGGFMYLAAIIDWHSKAILAYKISNCIDTTLVSDVLKEALCKYPKPKILNTDQGSQYTSYKHISILEQNDIKISMNGKGRSIDNIAIERFFRTLKHSNIYISNYESIKELKQGVKEYIYKYNFKRFHSSIGYKKPMKLYLDFIKMLKNVA